MTLNTWYKRGQWLIVYIGHNFICKLINKKLSKILTLESSGKLNDYKNVLHNEGSSYDSLISGILLL